MSHESSSPEFDVSNTDTTYTPTPYSFNSKVMVGAIIVLILVIFFILLLHVYAKWFLQRSRSRAIRHGIAFVSPSAAASAHINTGLDKAAIAQLPTFVYKAPFPVDNLEAGTIDESVAQQPSLECAVCLSEFQENEKGRRLPSCKHTFHTECIDMWLLSHSTCPLCRENVVPAMANAPETAATQEQHQEGEDLEPSPGTTEGTPVVEYPCNVLFWGNQTQVVLSQEPSSSSLPLSQSSGMPSARALPQITIDIPPIEGNLHVSASGTLSAKCASEQEACSSQLPKSPGLRASIKRMLSRQSSRQKSFSQEGYEGSPK